MNIERLSYFLAVAKHLNFTRAAHECGIAQTLMSRHIAAMEKEMGVPLFARDNKQVALTPAGDYLYEHAQVIEARYHEVVQHICAITTDLPQTLQIGIGPYEASLAEERITAFKARHPNVTISVFQYLYSELIGRVNNHLLDIAFAPTQALISLEPSVKTRVLCPQTLCVITSGDHPLSTHKKLTPDQLQEECFITLNEDKGPCSLENLYRVMGEHFAFVPKNILQTNTLTSVFLTVGAERGIALLPEICKKECPKSVKALPLSQKATYGDFVMLKNEERQNPAIVAFWEN